VVQASIAGVFRIVLVLDCRSENPDQRDNGGIRLWDDNVKWGQIETAKGVYDWSGLDSIMSKAQAQHVDVLYTVGDTPKWAGTIPPKSPCGPTGSYSCSAPTDVKSDGTGADSYYSDFVTALVKRYKGQIAYYRIYFNHRFGFVKASERGAVDVDCETDNGSS
jgi:hypothetical protein